MNRRDHLAALLAMAATLLPAGKLRALEARMEELVPHYGLIGQMLAQPGQRAALAAILSEGTGAMPGNIAYLVGEDSANPDAIWVVELWDSREAHAASLNLPAVQAAIQRARAMIAGFGQRIEFRPVASARP